jgi:hypothetical protein
MAFQDFPKIGTAYISNPDAWIELIAMKMPITASPHGVRLDVVRYFSKLANGVIFQDLLIPFPACRERLLQTEERKSAAVSMMGI